CASLHPTSAWEQETLPSDVGGCKDKFSLTKTPKLDRSDGGKEVKERATKRKLPFTVGTNGDQKDSDTGTEMTYSTLKICLGWGEHTVSSI
uniref:Uncharacterized protein n=1 Tax=Melopsittacus undulatus TaxID=13146 RepID=A0A8V5GXG3_MELUD